MRNAKKKRAANEHQNSISLVKYWLSRWSFNESDAQTQTIPFDFTTLTTLNSVCSSQITDHRSQVTVEAAKEKGPCFSLPLCYQAEDEVSDEELLSVVELSALQLFGNFDPANSDISSPCLEEYSYDIAITAII